MTALPDVDAEADAFRVALGKKLRQACKRLGLARGAFIAKSGLDIAVQTLATYELGTRSIGLSQLFALCRALGIHPIALLDDVYRTVAGRDTGVLVDLAKLAWTAAVRLQPLCSWARLRVRDRPAGEGTEVAFDPQALDSMAEWCRMDPAAFIEAMVQNGIATRFVKVDIHNGQ